MAWTLLANPMLQRVLAVAAVLGIALTVAYCSGREDGAETVTRQVTKQNERAENTAEAAEQDVAACIGQGGFWDVTTGTCR
ncbi:MAG: hypothetical protein AAGF32_04565 [Pseudomonadota bacterium]